ncbi:MAG: DUF4192 domain-containing protein [Cellulomonas sp.]|nr:DUF4192 domain-containing protein [Actinomycetota bacterium]MCG2798284.1 DUF4192 domain-containing protein [Cellulomonas sp.]
MTATMRLREPREMLALIPHQIGFRPVESAVVVSLRPPHGRVGLVLRVDLSALADPSCGPQLARTLVGHLDRDGARSAVLVVYTAHDPRGTPGHEVWSAVEHLREAAHPLGEVPAWAVTDTGYLSLDCAGECCPPGGRPLVELDSTQVGARMVLAGSAVAERREDVALIGPAGGEARRAVSRVRTRWSTAGAAAAASGPDELERWRLASVRAWRDLVAAATVDPAARGSALGRLEAGLRDRRVRDAVLIALLPGTGDLPEALVRGSDPDPAVVARMDEALGALFDPVRGVRPPERAAAVHTRVLEQVVSHGRAGEQAPACTLLAVLAWWAGGGVRADLLLERAMREDPGYRLAQLYAQAVATGMPPGWVAVDG